MFRVAIVASLLAASSFSPAVAKEGQKDDASASDESKVVCRREIPTGSVMAKKVCRTRAQWDAIAQQSQDDQRRNQDMDRSRSMTGLNRSN